MTYDLLLDVGGTGIKGGYLSVEENEISEVYDFPSHSDKDKETVIRHFAAICGQIWDRIEGEGKSLGSIRMAFPGPFDYEKGISLVKGLSKYESLYGVSVPREMTALGRKENYSFIPSKERNFKFINDVEAYALGVMYKRKYGNKHRIMYLCIGTGAGSAYSVDGRISAEPREGIPENGWVYPVPFKDSILDDYISVRGIKRLARKYCNSPLSPLELSKMALDGNDQAIKAYKEFGENLNTAVLPLLGSFRADIFVLGGNISHSGGLFLSRLEEECKKRNIRIAVEEDTSKLVMMGLTGI